MRILIVTQYFWPESFRINDLVQGLVERGHDVTVLTGKPNYPEGKVYPEFKAEPGRFGLYAGSPVLRVPMTPRGEGKVSLVLNYFSFALSASIFGPWKLRKKKFDAIFVFEPSPISVGLPAIVLRRRMKTPLAFWVLDLWPESLSATGAIKSPAILNAVGILVKFIFDRCDLILAQSRSFVSTIRKLRQREEKVVYFPSWADKVPPDVDREAAREIQPGPDTFTVVFTGNIGEAQDFPSILDAATLLKDREDVRWVIVGEGRMAAWARSEVEARGLSGKVLFPGRFPLERMPSFYAHADALLVSLKKEPIFALTIPGKLQSYLAEGKPILAMLDGEGAEIIDRAEAGLTCAAGDSEGLANAVKALASMSIEDRQAMGRNARDLGEREFDRDRQIDYLLERLGRLTYSSEKMSVGSRD